MKRQVADRLMLTSISMTVVAISQLEPQSLSYFMVKSGGLPAQLCMGFLLGVSIVAFIDTLLNDMLPDQVTLSLQVPAVKVGRWRSREVRLQRCVRLQARTALGVRRGIWMSIAITYAGIAFVSNKADLGWSVSIFYMIFAARCVGIAYLDLYYQFKDVVQDPATPISTTISGALADE